MQLGLSSTNSLLIRTCSPRAYIKLLDTYSLQIIFYIIMAACCRPNYSTLNNIIITTFNFITVCCCVQVWLNPIMMFFFYQCTGHYAQEVWNTKPGLGFSYDLKQLPLCSTIFHLMFYPIVITYTCLAVFCDTIKITLHNSDNTILNQSVSILLNW